MNSLSFRSDGVRLSGALDWYTGCPGLNPVISTFYFNRVISLVAYQSRMLLFIPPIVALWRLNHAEVLLLPEMCNATGDADDA